MPSIVLIQLIVPYSQIHDLILIVEKIKIPLQKYTYAEKTRITDDKSIANFQSYLREES
jgi:hypothetical protein